MISHSEIDDRLIRAREIRDELEKLDIEYEVSIAKADGTRRALRNRIEDLNAEYAKCFYSYKELEEMPLSHYVYYLGEVGYAKCGDGSKIKKFDAHKLMLEKTEQEYDFMKSKLWLKTKEKMESRDTSKKPDAEDAILSSILNAAVSFTGGMIFSAVRQFQKKDKIQQAKNEYLTTDEAEQIADNIKANLNAKYPTLDTSDMNASNIIGKMRDAYDNCYSEHYTDVTIKPGWENYYVDCRHGLIDNLENILCQGNYSMPSGGEALGHIFVDAGFVASLGALATLAIIFGPRLINKTRFKLMKHELNKNEKISNVAQLINDYEKAKEDLQECNISINEFYDIVKDVDAKYNNLSTKKTKSRKNKDDEDAHENALTL